MRPLSPLYPPGLRFDVTADGLRAWQASACFERMNLFYHGWPHNSLFNIAGRALLHHLVVMRRPERILEIGTMYAGTTEVLARAAWEAGTGHVETIDPYGSERCPKLIATFPPDLQKLVTFFPVSSAMHFDDAIHRGKLYDLILIDGNHELEFALFDLECAARVMRPGGIVVLDNIEQVGPRFAAKIFLERHPEWIDIAGVVGLADPADPLAEPTPSFPGTKNYILQAPADIVIGGTPRSFGSMACDVGAIDGVELDLALPRKGILHVQAFVRTFGITHPEEKMTTQRVAIDGAGPVRIKFDRPLRSDVQDADGLSRQIEIIVAFIGDDPLALTCAPQPFSARDLPNPDGSDGRRLTVK
jgi:hypothetical protein